MATILEICHQAAGHPGTVADCARCAQNDPNRPEVERRARAAARRRTAAVKRQLGAEGSITNG